MTGGYKIINLGDNNITSDGTEVVISGVHDAVENNYRKALLLAGLVIDGVEKANLFVNFINTAGVYSAPLFANAEGKLMTISVGQTDNVKITVAE